MNQILDYNPNKKSGGSSNSDKIVRVFAIILIIFALCLLSSGAYGIYKRNKDTKTPNVEATKAIIEVEKLENKATIKVTHDKVIDKLIYSWNNDNEASVKGTGQTSMEKTIDLPQGENTLNIKVIDIDNGETTYEETIIAETGIDIINPRIELSITDDKKIKIVATDNVKIDFITYRWNDESEEKIESDELSPRRIETEIEIRKGTNDLTIVAVDSSNSTTTETKSFTGVTKPEVFMELSESGDKISIVARHENGLKEIKFNLNNEDYTIDIGNDNPKEIQFAVDLQVGYNRIILTAISVEETEFVYDGQCEYQPESSDTTEQTNEGEENQPTDEE